jgi:hypothetical protein
MLKFFFLAFSSFVISTTGCTDSNSRITIEQSDIKYEKPGTSNQVLKGNKVEYELWYNGNQWEIFVRNNPPADTSVEKSRNKNRLLTHASKDVFVSIDETPEIMSHKESFKHYAKWIKLQGGQILDKEIRSVNGRDILFIESTVQSESKPFVSLNYVLTNSSGGVSVTAAVAENSFERHKTDIFNLLNGLVGIGESVTSAE